MCVSPLLMSVRQILNVMNMMEYVSLVLLLLTKLTACIAILRVRPTSASQAVSITLVTLLYQNAMKISPSATLPHMVAKQTPDPNCSQVWCSNQKAVMDVTKKESI